MYDVVIVGAGPAGLAAAIAATKRSLRYVVLEKGALVNTLLHFPANMVYFTTPELLEIGGLPFVTPYEKPTRLEALRYYRRVTDTYRRLSAHTIRRLRDYVESSLAEDLDVTMMANVAALSPAHFARAFAATVGMTPFHYVMTRRLARAHELLERTDRSALAIALDVGFKTPSHFTSRFRREFGVTPREIRPDSRRPDERLDVDLPDPAHRSLRTTSATASAPASTSSSVW